MKKIKFIPTLYLENEETKKEMDKVVPRHGLSNFIRMANRKALDELKKHGK